MIHIIAVLLLSLTTLIVSGQSTENITETILRNAEADNIDLTALDGYEKILADIVAVYNTSDFGSIPSLGNLSESKIDVHSHIVPDWFGNLVPITGQNPTPAWNFTGYLEFSASLNVTHSIMSFSTPGANIFKGNRTSTIALARLCNEQLVAFARSAPSRLSFYAVVPLPYVDEAIVEAKYALGRLGALGIGMYSNYEGIYPGNSNLTPFFAALDALGGPQIIHIHPGTPFLDLEGTFVEANPTEIATAEIEFYFETARVFSQLTRSETIVNFTNIHWILPHVGGAFPSVIDRLLRRPLSVNTTVIYDIFRTRFWWDSAGPTYTHQVGGLLGYEIPTTQLLFGTDFPYGPPDSPAESLAELQASKFLTAEQKETVFQANAQGLFGL